MASGAGVGNRHPGVWLVGLLGVSRCRPWGSGLARGGPGGAAGGLRSGGQRPSLWWMDAGRAHAGASAAAALARVGVGLNVVNRVPPGAIALADCSRCAAVQRALIWTAGSWSGSAQNLVLDPDAVSRRKAPWSRRCVTTPEVTGKWRVCVRMVHALRGALPPAGRVGWMALWVSRSRFPIRFGCALACCCVAADHPGGIPRDCRVQYCRGMHPGCRCG